MTSLSSSLRGIFEHRLQLIFYVRGHAEKLDDELLHRAANQRVEFQPAFVRFGQKLLVFHGAVEGHFRRLGAIRRRGWRQHVDLAEIIGRAGAILEQQRCSSDRAIIGMVGTFGTIKSFIGFSHICARMTHSPLFTLSIDVTLDEVQVLKNPSTSPLSMRQAHIGGTFVAGDYFEIGI